MTPTSPAAPHDSSWLRREAVIERFESAWAKDGTADLPAFLPPAGSPDRRELLLDLARVDLEYRWERGERLQPEDYVARFPELADPAGPPLELIATEIEVRQHLGCAPAVEELTNRFPGRAAELASAALTSVSSGATIASAAGGAAETAAGAAGLPRRLGRYELRELLGRGSFATVYRAWDPTLRREVAVKVPRSDLLEKSDFRDRVLREGQSAARLRHPAIVSLYEVGGEDGTPFLVYELVRGTTLAQLSQQPSPRQAAEWVARLAEALDYAHAAGIVHRDVKPANVMIDQAGRPMLADFGLALQTDALASLTHEGDVLGTPAYMAPEQAAGRKREVGPLSDVYSLGALLYELLCGRPPFQGSMASILHHVIHDEPASPRQHRPSIPRDLETICLKAMAKEPRRRYATAGALAEDLQRYLQHLPVRARRLGPVGRLALWCHRKPALAAAIALGIVACLTIAAVSFRQVVEERDRYQAERDRAQLLVADMALDRGISLCEQGEVGHGMLWLARSLSLAPTDAHDLRWTIRANLAAWQHQLARPRRVVRYTGKVIALAFHPNGSTFVAGGEDGTAGLWDAGSGDAFGPTLGQAEARIVAFSPNGQTILTSSGSSHGRLWEAGTGKPLGAALQTADRLDQVLCSHDGAYFLSVKPTGALSLWETWTERLLATLPEGPGNIRSFAFSSNGGRLVVSTDSNRTWLWKDLQSKPLLLPTQNEYDIVVSVFSPDGRSVWSGGGDRTVRAWDATSGQSLGIVLRHQEYVRSLAFSPDGEIVVTGSSDRTARLWETRSGRPIGAPLRHPGRVFAVAFAPDGRHVLTGSDDHRVWLWELPALPVVGAALQHEYPVWGLAMSADGRRVVTGSGLPGSDRATGSAQLWDVTTKARLGPPLPHPDAVIALAISRDGETLATGDWKGTVQLWEAVSNRPLGPPLQQQGGSLVVVAFSPDEQVVLTARLPAAPESPEQSSDTNRLWDLKSRQGVGSLRGHTKPIRDAVFSVDGRLILTGSYDQTARLWDARTLRPLGAPLPHEGEVGAVALSPDSRLAAVGSDDARAKVWEVATGKFVGPPLVHQGAVRKVAFSPDGRLILTGSIDHTARFWVASTHKPVGPALRHDGAIETGAFAPDGRTVLTGSRDKTVRFWPVPTPLEDQPEGLALWVEVLTGMELDENGVSRPLPAESWQERKRRWGGTEP